jgi:hypothetical protein
VGDLAVVADELEALTKRETYRFCVAVDVNGHTIHAAGGFLP